MLCARRYMGPGFLMVDCLPGASTSLFATMFRPRKMKSQANGGAIRSVPSHMQHSLQQRPISCVSSLLIKAVERFNVMNCASGEQSLIHGQEQESKPTVTFSLTLNTLISIHSINFRGPCRPIAMPGTQRDRKQSKATKETCHNICF